MGEKTPTVLIVGPPWPRGGTARVLQNQVEYYRSRGFETVFIAVPLHCAYTEDHPSWEGLQGELLDLGADQTLTAAIDTSKFLTAKYTTWLKKGFAGTALDWIVFTARSAGLTSDAIAGLSDRPIALIHVNHVFTLGFAQRLQRQLARGRRIPLLLETHDVQARVLSEKQETNPWTHALDTLAELIRCELSYLKKMKVLVHCSVDDFDFFSERLPGQKHILTLPTIDGKFISDVDSVSSGSGNSVDLLFVGQSTRPNREAMQWFFEQVWPLIAHRGYRVKIVGQIGPLVGEELPELYQAFESFFTGPVAELASFYRAARCVFAPMVSGTGISIKTIEALALGKPFVGTSKAYRGMPMTRIERLGLAAYNTAQDFADALVRALSDGRALGETSRIVYSEIFSKRSAFATRDEALKIATGG